MGMLTEYYLQPQAADPVLSEAEALRCVRRFVPKARAVTAIDESGGEARTYFVDATIVLKVQRPQQLRIGTSLARETFFLHQIAAHASDLPVPRALGYARETPLLEYNIQTRMHGQAIANVALAPQARRAAISAVGRFLRRLHALPQEPLQQSAHFPADRDAADLRARLAEYFDVANRRLEKTRRTWPAPIGFDRLKERTLAQLRETQALVALHSNPGAPHAFVAADTGRFTGIIDFGDAYISHPALDLWRWRWPDERAAVLAGYTADARVDDAFMDTWHAVGIVADLLLIAAHPQREHEALADLMKLVGELR